MRKTSVMSGATVGCGTVCASVVAAALASGAQGACVFGYDLSYGHHALPSQTFFSESVRIRASAVYDDGSGPALYVGGVFATIGGSHCASVAKYEGTEWKPLGGGAWRYDPFGGADGAGMDVPGTVNAMAVFDADGPGPLRPLLYIGGTFESVDGFNVGAFGVAVWDGSGWSAPSNFALDFDGVLSINALQVLDTPSGQRLFACGQFALDSGTAGIAELVNGQWVGVGGTDVSIAGEPVCMHAYDDGSGPALFVGGVIARVYHALSDLDVLPASNLLKFDGSSWSTPWGTLPPDVRPQHMLSFDADGAGAGSPRLMIMSYASIGTPLTMRAWDGTTLSGNIAIPGPGFDIFNGRAACVIREGGVDRLYIGARSQTLGTDLQVLKYDGSAFVNAGDSIRGATYEFLGAHTIAGSTVMFVSGVFSGTQAAPCENMLRWNGSTWSCFGASDGGASMSVFASTTSSAFPGVDGLLMADIDGAGPNTEMLVAFGRFNRIGGADCQNIAVHTPTGWAPLGAAMPNQQQVLAAVMHAGSLYISSFAHVPTTGASSFGVYKLSTTGTWTPVGPADGFDAPITTLVSAQLGTALRLVALGNFTTTDISAATPPDVLRGAVMSTAGTGWTRLAAGIQDTAASDQIGYGYVPGPGISSAVGYVDGTTPALFVGGQYIARGRIPARVLKFASPTTRASADAGLPPEEDLSELSGATIDVPLPSPELFVLQGQLYLWIDQAVYVWNSGSASWTPSPAATPYFEAAKFLGVADLGSGTVGVFSTFDGVSSVSGWRLMTFNGTVFAEAGEYGRFVGSPTVVLSTGSASAREVWFGGEFEGVGGTIAPASPYTLGGTSSYNIARWACFAPACRADFNASGDVTVQDIFDFLAAWFASSPTGDFNDSGVLSVQDIFDFLAAWFAGC